LENRYPWKTKCRKWITPVGHQRSFGSFTFTFSEGGKVKFRNYFLKKVMFSSHLSYLKQNYIAYDRGDYQIQISFQYGQFFSYSDENIWNLIQIELDINIIKTLRQLYEYISKPEKEIYEAINSKSISNELKAFYYYSWHKFHVEERGYPSKGSPYYKDDENPKQGLNGGKRFIVATYIMIKENKPPNEVYKIFQSIKSDIVEKYWKDISRV
jgi:hypothetical protein